jgi:AhpC/TSA antioxidant enzyme
LRVNEQAFRQRGAAVAAIGLGEAAYAKAFREETGIRFPLLVDEKREAYQAMELKSANLFHLLRKDNFERRARAKAGGHSQHNLGKNPFQLGGSFVFGPGDVDRFAHFSETFGDNASIQSLFKALA